MRPRRGTTRSTISTRCVVVEMGLPTRSRTIAPAILRAAGSSPNSVKIRIKEVDFVKLQEVLLKEGIQKFADPQMALLELISKKRGELASPAA